MTGLPVHQPVGHERVGVDEFERMIAAGVFAPDERLELIDGEIVAMSPIGDPHMAGVDRLNRLFVLAVHDRAQVRAQGSFVANDVSRPEPDLLLLRPRHDDYATSAPRPIEVLLAVEVAGSSLTYDRERKRPLYGSVGVPEMWIVDLSGHVIEVATKPAPDGYESIVQVGSGDAVAPLAFPDVVVDVADLFRGMP